MTEQHESRAGTRPEHSAERALNSRASVRQEVQQEIASILEIPWSDDLGQECFLDAGGDSVHAMRIAAALRTKYRVKLTLKRLLDSVPLANVVDELVDSYFQNQQ